MSLEDGMIMKEKITQKAPAKETKTGSKPLPAKEAVTDAERPGKFSIKQ